jgi:type VII secretion integral membrane protein EccD
VASSVIGELSRVTIVAPKTRVDLALPTHVPLADLLPTLLRYAGADLADDGARQGGWALSRLGGQILDSSRTPGQLDVRDGEVLYFTPRAEVAPELVFDDVVDAVATATRNRPGPWTLDATRRFATIFGSTALLGGALVVLFAGPPQLPSALVGLGVGLVLIVCATLLARVGKERRSSMLFALVALCYGGIGGLLLLAGDRPLHQLASPHVLVAATALVVYAAVITLAVGTATPIFLGAAAAGAMLGVGAVICLAFGASPAAAAAIIAAVVFGVIPLLPMLAYRMARLPIPSVPTGPADLKSDTETVDGVRILALSDRAHAFLTGFTNTVAAILFAAEVVVALTGGFVGVALCAVLALLLLLRARPLASRSHRLPLLAAGTLGLGLVAVVSFLAGSPLLRLTAVLGGLIIAAVAAIVYGFAVAGKRISPLWGRVLDIGEIVLILGMLPLAAWVCGLYGWIRAIKS